MMVHTQLITPQRNAPIMGLTQDSLTAVRMFTQRDTFLTFSDMMQLVQSLIAAGTLQNDSKKNPYQLSCRSRDPEIVAWRTVDRKAVARLVFAARFAVGHDVQVCRERQGREQAMPYRLYLDPFDTHVRIVDGQLLTGTLDKKTCGSIRRVACAHSLQRLRRACGS